MVIHFADGSSGNDAACGVPLIGKRRSSARISQVSCEDCKCIVAARAATPAVDARTVTASGPLDLRAFAMIARGEHRRIGDDRERLVSNLEWLIRDLTHEVERLKADPHRMPSQSILTGSLPHDIQAAATRINEASRLLHEFVHEFEQQKVDVGVTTVRP